MILQTLWRKAYFLPPRAPRNVLIYMTLLLFSLPSFASEFDLLMGKETPHWAYVSQPQDKALLDTTRSLYERQSPAQFQETGPYKIPPVVHFIWLGPKSFPPGSVENIRTWIANHPTWTFKFWTDREREAPCEGMEVIDVAHFTFSKLAPCFAASQNFGEKSDLLRYEILLQEGGVYADHDANSLRPFDGLHRGYDFFCCLETPHEPFVGRNITCGNGVLGARPHHPCVQRVIDLIADNWQPLGEKFRGKDPYSQTEVVMQRTYIALTKALADTLDLPGNSDIVFPSSYFFSKSGMQSLYSKHFYASAWDNSRSSTSATEIQKTKLLHKALQKSRRLEYLLITLLSLNLLCTLLLFKRKKPKTILPAPVK